MLSYSYSYQSNLLFYILNRVFSVESKLLIAHIEALDKMLI